MESASCKNHLDDAMLLLVHQRLLPLRKSAPKKENHSLPGLVADQLDDCVRKMLPTNFTMGICLVCPLNNGKN